MSSTRLRATYKLFRRWNRAAKLGYGVMNCLYMWIPLTIELGVDLQTCLCSPRPNLTNISLVVHCFARACTLSLFVRSLPHCVFSFRARVHIHTHAPTRFLPLIFACLFFATRNLMAAGPSTRQTQRGAKSGKIRRQLFSA